MDRKVKKEGYINAIFLFLWWILITYSSLIALEPEKAVTQYKQDTWQSEHGFTQNSAIAIYQTRDGYIWLGTVDGLVRFDGVVFKTFKKENTRQLHDNNITSLLEDQKGNFWIGTSEGGLSCLKAGEFISYTTYAYPFLKRISVIFEDRQGVLWIGTLNNGLTHLKNGKFTPYTADDGLAGNRVYDFYEDKNGVLWIGTSAGLCIRTPSGKFNIYANKNGPFDEYITSIFGAKNGGLWLGCLNGIYRLNNNDTTHFGESDGLPSLKITCLYEDTHQNLWAGTDGDGLIRMKNSKIEIFPPGNLLAASYIRSIYEDREKNLWVGTLKEGLHLIKDTPVVSYSTSEGLSHEIVNWITESQDGSLWIGTENGVNRLKNNRLTLEWTGKERLLSNRVTTMMEDSEGTLWIGTEAGLNRYENGKLISFNNENAVLNTIIIQLREDKRGSVFILTLNHLIEFHKGKFTVLLNKEGLSSDFFLSLYLDRESVIWIGTYGSGIYRWKNGDITHYTNKDGLVHNEVENFYEDKTGNLFIGTRGGLSLLAKGKFINITTQDGLMDSYIYHIVEDDLGYLWLTGRTGISRINQKELFDFITKKIEKINPVLLSESDGIKSPIGNHCIKTRDGKVWIATDKGLAKIDPSNFKRNEISPPIVIEELIADGEVFPVSKPLIIPPGKKRLEFHYSGLSFVKSRQIKFKLKLVGYDSYWVDAGPNRSTTYTGLSPGKYTFRVTACNSDGVWNEKGASFSFYLKPYFTQTFWFYFLVVISVLLSIFFFYRFRVRQLKAREKELGKLVELRTKDLHVRNIELEKAQQNIQHSKELIEAKNMQLESQTVQLKEQSEKLKDMDKVKSRFFANISHEFRTPLTLIMGPLEQMLSGDRDTKEKRKLNLMLRNSQRLLGLINQLLELSKLESGKVKLQARRQNVIPILRGIAASFEPLADQRELELTFHAEAEDITLYLDAEKLENMMSNLLINALKFTPPGGKITVKTCHDSDYSTEEINNQKFLPGDVRKAQSAVRQAASAMHIPPGGFLRISVSDTGPGIPREQLANIFDRFYQSNSAYESREKGSGIGLALVKELVQIHHGKIDVYSQEGKGTEFIISLPMGDALLKPGEIVEAPGSETHPKPLAELPALHTMKKEPGVTADAADSFKTPGIDETGAVMTEEDIDALSEKKEIILVVEDSVEVQDYIKGSLEPLYTVVEAGDGREGIQNAREIIPDLIISDIMMPEVDGYELCSVLKSDVQTSHIPIILLTAKASEENILQGLETGADDYITKPFNTKILKARIKNLIDIRHQLQKNINREMTLQPVKTSISKIDREFLHDLHKVINKNLSDEEFNVEQLCKKLYMGRTTLYRKVLALTGETPTDFIRSYRLKRGAELLKKNFGTVLEVAFEVGFSNSSYFAKCFKEKFHQLPSEYQASEGE
jgi:ligand-binding sensor domain-containing protein/signal transduction histidine kinase/DNA-binding response OmpR family regulator